MSEGILERLSQGVVLGDGGYLLELERRGYVQAGPFVPEVSITCPEVLAALHREFVGEIAKDGHTRYPIEAFRPDRPALTDPDFEQTLAM